MANSLGFHQRKVFKRMQAVTLWYLIYQASWAENTQPCLESEGSVENGKEILWQKVSSMCSDFQSLYVIIIRFCLINQLVKKWGPCIINLNLILFDCCSEHLKLLFSSIHNSV